MFLVLFSVYKLSKVILDFAPGGIISNINGLPCSSCLMMVQKGVRSGVLLIDLIRKMTLRRVLTRSVFEIDFNYIRGYAWLWSCERLIWLFIMIRSLSGSDPGVNVYLELRSLPLNSFLSKCIKLFNYQREFYLLTRFEFLGRLLYFC